MHIKLTNTALQYGKFRYVIGLFISGRGWLLDAHILDIDFFPPLTSLFLPQQRLQDTTLDLFLLFLVVLLVSFTARARLLLAFTHSLPPFLEHTQPQVHLNVWLSVLSVNAILMPTLVLIELLNVSIT